MTVPDDPTVDLTTVADLQAWLTSQDVTAPAGDQLQQMLTSVSQAIQDWLGYGLIAQSYSATFDGKGTQKVAFPETPVTQVASLSIDGVSIPASSGPLSPGYVVTSTRHQSWLTLRGYRFIRGPANCEISYTAGYQPDAVPAALIQACREGLTAVVQVAAREPGLIAEKVGGLEERYAAPGSAGTNNPVQYVLTPAVTLALTPYRRVVSPW